MVGWWESEEETFDFVWGGEVSSRFGVVSNIEEIESLHFKMILFGNERSKILGNVTV